MFELCAMSARIFARKAKRGSKDGKSLPVNMRIITLKDRWVAYDSDQLTRKIMKRCTIPANVDEAALRTSR